MSSEFSRFVRQLEKIEMETKVKKIKINPKENAKWWYNLSLEDKQKHSCSNKQNAQSRNRRAR